MRDFIFKQNFFLTFDLLHNIHLGISKFLKSVWLDIFLSKHFVIRDG